MPEEAGPQQICLADVAQPQPWARRDAQVPGHSCQEPRLEQEWPHQSWPPPQVSLPSQGRGPPCRAEGVAQPDPATSAWLPWQAAPQPQCLKETGEARG